MNITLLSLQYILVIPYGPRTFLRLIRKLSSFIQRISPPWRQFVAFNILFFILWMCLRVYERFLLGASHSLPENSFTLSLIGIGSDIVLLLFLAALLAIPYLLLSWYSRRAAEILLLVVALVYSTCNVALLQYFAVTYVPLGSDLFGYSWVDIKKTVNSSGGFEVTTFIPFLLAFLFTYGAAILARTSKTTRPVICGRRE